LCDLIETAFGNPEKYSLFEQSRVYVECMAPAGFYYSLRTPLFNGKEYIAEVKMNRARKWGEYSDQDVEIMAALAPHFSQAVSQSRAQRIQGDPMIKWNSFFSARGLTPREQEVAKSLVAGKSNRAIAQELGLSFFTVKDHVKSIFSKLGIHRRGELLTLSLETALGLDNERPR
jgi:DNA-binding NarL/FixJ family response regulator